MDELNYDASRDGHVLESLSSFSQQMIPGRTMAVPSSNDRISISLAGKQIVASHVSLVCIITFHSTANAWLDYVCQGFRHSEQMWSKTGADTVKSGHNGS